MSEDLSTVATVALSMQSSRPWLLVLLFTTGSRFVEFI